MSTIPEFTFWEIVLLGLYLLFIQLGTRFLIEKISKWFKKRKDNTIYSLYTNGTFDGKYTLKECKETYERTPYITMKGAGKSKKKKEFYIDVDNR